MMAHYPPDAERLSETQVATASGPRAFGTWDGDAVVSPRLHQASVRHVISTKATEYAIGLESHASKARARVSAGAASIGVTTFRQASQPGRLCTPL